MTDVVLRGCRPTPVSSYLKGLGVLRVVAQQADPEVRARWVNDELHLRSTLDEAGLLHFFAREYCPSPVMSPWNGGSGFYWKWDEKKGEFRDREACELVESIRHAVHPRLGRYREALDGVMEVLWRLADSFDPAAVDKKTRDDALILQRDGAVRAIAKEKKDLLLLTLRSDLPDDVLEWLDAAFVLQPEGQAALPLLGSGGNDGNLDFAVTFMGRVRELLPLDAGDDATDRTAELLEDALFRRGRPALDAFSPGQFDPGAAGGPNAAEGYGGPTVVNPWDFVLMIEGSLLFAGSVARRLATAHARATFPFTVTQANATAAGAASVAPADRGLVRGETWLPLWSQPASLIEVQRLFAEGRAQVGKHQAVTGLDFARAAASLGVDRGIESFERIGLLQRQGRMFIAAPLGRVRVRGEPSVHLIDHAEPFLDALRRFCASDRSTATARSALLRIEDAIFRHCQQPSCRALQDVLAALGAAERAVARSPGAREGVRRPLAGLREEWLTEINDGSPELEIAAALASIRDDVAGPLRMNLEPVDKSGRKWDASSRSAVWARTRLELNLMHVLERRLLDGQRTAETSDPALARDERRPLVPIEGSRRASFSSVARFINGETDDDRIEDLLWALAGLTNFPKRFAQGDAHGAPRSYALLKLVLLPRPLSLRPDAEPLTITAEPAVVSLLRANASERAVATALRRLRAHGLRPPGAARRGRGSPLDFSWNPPDPARVAAALLIPVTAAPLARLVLRRTDTDEPNDDQLTTFQQGDHP